MCFYGTFVFPDVFLTNQEQRLRHKESRFLLSTLLQYTFTKTKAVCVFRNILEKDVEISKEKVTLHVMIHMTYSFLLHMQLCHCCSIC